MGADIHSFAEVRKNGKWVRVEKPVFKEGKEPFGVRSYAVFGFLADVRNYSCCAPISEPKGLPEDSEYLNAFTANDGWGNLRQEMAEFQDFYHSCSHLTLKELLDFDYEQEFWDRRISRTTTYPNGAVVTDGACLAEEGEGETVTYRNHLGSWYFEDLETLKKLGAPEDVRVVFGFDS